MNQVNRQTVFRNSRQSLKPKLRSLHRQFKRTSTPGFFEPISLFLGFSQSRCSNLVI